MKITTNTLHARLLQSIRSPKLFLVFTIFASATVSDSTASEFSTSLPFPSCYLADFCLVSCGILAVSSSLTIITRCAYAQGRVKRLSPSIYLFVCLCVCRQKTRLFAVLPLENRHEIVLYRSASQFIFFERCLESRTSLLSSAMAMGF